MHRLSSPRMMLIVSMAIFGTLGPFVRHISVASGELALYRAILAAGLILVYFRPALHPAGAAAAAGLRRGHGLQLDPPL